MAGGDPKFTNTKISKVVHLVLGSWNLWTFLDNPHADQLERRTLLVAEELNKYGIQIAVLSETHFAGEGHLMEHGSGFTFFWNGQGADECCESDMGFCRKNPSCTQALKPSE